MADAFRMGIDVGGTFTDIVLLQADGTVYPKKVLSTPQNFSIAIKQGIQEALAEHDLSGDQIREYAHGATVATNAIITRTGAVTGLITTKGFRDALEIRRMRQHKLYDLTWEKPAPLVPRHLRQEVPGRLNSMGEELEPLDEEAVQSVIQRLLNQGVETIAVCLLNAYAAGQHERRVRELIAQAVPDMLVSLSSEVLPEIKEYERTSTTVINAYVQPTMSRYFLAMERDLQELGINVPIMVMQSNGGMMPSELARERPIHIIESGPAAGVTGCYHLARRMGLENAMTLDMGGTTAKAAMIEDGEISRSPEYEVGGAISIGHRLMKGSGYLLRVPSVDLAEVGAGGGSIAWADPGGALQVGPHSAGASPGPACYNHGGVEPTITDANVHLGLTNPDHLAGGTLKIYPDLADKAILDRVAGPLGLELTATAWGIRTVANSTLIRAMRAVSTERGRDPRRFDLFAFGGMGPVHAVDIAEELGMARVIVPPLPGLFSSFGLLFADVEHHLIRTLYALASDADFEQRVNKVLGELVEEGTSTLMREGYEAAHQSIQLLADSAYVGQDVAIGIALPDAALNAQSVSKLVEDFHQEHNRTYGYRSDREQVRIVALRCLARGLSATPRVPDTLRATEAPGWKAAAGERKAYFGPALGWVTVPVMGRRDLSERPLGGPLIIEEDNSLTVVTPGWHARLDEWSNIVLQPKTN